MFDFLIHIDKQLFVLINSTWSAPWADAFFPFITDLHKEIFFQILLLPIILWVFIQKKGFKTGMLTFLFCALSLGSSDLVGNWGFKKTVQRLRPAETQGLEVKVRSSFGGYSFVSNHSANLFNFATFTSALFPQARIPLFGIAMVIGYSRVYNGVHFPADVLMGAILGIVVGTLFSKLCFATIKRLSISGGS